MGSEDTSIAEFMWRTLTESWPIVAREAIGISGERPETENEASPEVGLAERPATAAILRTRSAGQRSFDWGPQPDGPRTGSA